MNVAGYQPGDRVWYRNSFGQEFYVTVLRTHVDARGKGILIVKQDGWDVGTPSLHLDEQAILHRHFPRTSVTQP